MKYLYHGSKFKQDSLKPGIHYTGNITRWDETESNEYLYATPDREEAIRQGIASTIEKMFDIDRFELNKKHMLLKYSPDAKKLPSLDAIMGLTIYLYTIHYRKEDGWMVVNNKVNGLGDREYKTAHSLSHQIFTREEIHAKDWLKDVDIEFHPPILTPSQEAFQRYFQW